MLTDLVLPRPLPEMALLSPASMADMDRKAAALGAARMDLPGAGLMEHAGRAVAHAVRSFSRPCRVLVLAGPGNNGGDGYVAARLLAQMGWPVTVAALAAPKPGSDAAWAASRWRGPLVPMTAEAVRGCALVIDAVFGAGLARPVDSAVSRIVRAAAEGARGKVVAVDVPSGLDGATGQTLGDVAPAALTVTFVRYKPGHFLMPGRDVCGRLMLADIGMPEAALAAVRADAWLNRPGLWSLPDLATAAHKYTRGHVTVLGGAAMTGAARLAASAARHAGAGLVTIATEGDAAAALYRAGDAGLLVTTDPPEALLQDQRRRVWICGPGLEPEAVARVLPVLIRAGRRVVADAGAFSFAAGQPQRLEGAAVMTPHEGEYTRVFGPIGHDKLAAARRAAARTGAVVVLKGPDTVIAAPDGRAAINASAPPWLGTAGAGDVLAGMVAAFLAQGMAGWDAACAAVFLHGRAAVLAGAGMLAEALPPLLPRAEAEAKAAVQGR